MPPKAAAKSSAPSKGGKGKAGNNTLRVILGVMAVVCAGVAYLAFLPDKDVSERALYLEALLMFSRDARKDGSSCSLLLRSCLAQGTWRELFSILIKLFTIIQHFQTRTMLLPMLTLS